MMPIRFLTGQGDEDRTGDYFARIDHRFSNDMPARRSWVAGQSKDDIFNSNHLYPSFATKFC
jgi:hypothetical protein